MTMFAAFIQYLPQILQLALQGATIIQNVTGKPANEAMQEAVDHYTPGKPNSPHLGPDAPALVPEAGGAK